MSTPNNNERVIINGYSINARMFHEALAEEAKNFLDIYKPKVKKKSKLNKIEYNYSKRKR